jgi:hypothetical protein
MNKWEFARWREDAFQSLRLAYSAEDASKILDWIEGGSTEKEIALIGEEMYRCLEAVVNLDEWHSEPHFLRVRMWLYAPYILSEGK